MRLPLALGLLVTFSLLAVACGGTDGESASTTTTTDAPTTTAADATTSTTEPPITTAPTLVSVELASYPFWDNEVSAVSPGALDALALAYVEGLEPGDEPQMERFLFGSVAVSVFDEVFEGTTPERRQELMWLMHLSGYFGGRWLRGVIADAQPDALVIGVNTTPSEDAFLATSARAAARLEAIDGDDGAVLAAARDALFDKPPLEEGGDPLRGLADNFGYNRGYLEEILATPPEGIETAPRFEVNCGGLFDCVYASPKLAVLEELGGFQALLNSEDPPDPELVAELIPVQAAAIPRGVGVWSGGLSVQGFSQESYDQLLDVSSSFLETVQAAALINTRAVAEDDVAAARTGLIAEAMMIVWLDAYFAGLLDGGGAILLPTFAA